MVAQLLSYQSEISLFASTYTFSAWRAYDRKFRQAIWPTIPLSGGILMNTSEDITLPKKLLRPPALTVSLKGHATFVI